MERTYLQLVFVDEGGKRRSINVPSPRDNITSSQVEEAMDDIIEANIFIIGLVSKHSAVVITTSREDIFS